MRRRIVISVSIVAGLALAIFLGGWFMLPRSRIKQETFEKIKKGMTLQEIEEIIGAPPGDYGVGNGDTIFTPIGAFEIEHHHHEIWLGQELGFFVWFDADGKVSAPFLMHVHRDYDSEFKRLLGSIGLKEKNQRPSFPKILR